MTFVRRRTGRRLFGAVSPVLVAMLLSAGAMRAQDMPVFTDTEKTPSAAVKIPEFDVASVKPNKSDGHMMRIMGKPDGFACSNLSLKTLIANAYGIKQDLISGGPGWVESVGYDIDAKVASADVETLKKLSPEQKRKMLVPLLAERFKLKLHVETKVLPVYELVVAKGGPKLKTPAPIDAAAEEKKSADEKRKPGMQMSRPGGFTGESIPVVALANQLSYAVHRTVLDKTGLTGMYDIELKWTPEEGPPQNSGDSGGAESGPSLFTALQEQLGLKLQAAKAPVDTIVIDHAEVPTEN